MTQWSNITLSPVTVSSGYSASAGSFNLIDSLNINSGNEYYKVKKFEMYESPEDLLALSVTWKRLRDSNTSTASKLLDRTLFENINSEDKLKANAIRDYYSKKFMMWKLKNDKSMTSFRQELNQFIHSDGLMFRDSAFGIVYHLPTFYEYDLNLDTIKSHVVTNQGFKKMDLDGKVKVLTLSPKLSPIKKVHKKRKRTNTMEYWFKDLDCNAGVVITIDNKNPLEHVWEHIFNTEKVLQIKGAYCRRNLDDFEYFSVDKWELQYS